MKLVLNTHQLRYQHIFTLKTKQILLDAKHSSNLTEVAVELKSSADDNKRIPDSQILFLAKAMDKKDIVCLFDKRHSQIK